MQAIVRNLARLGRWAQGPAACFILVVLLPGGSLLALLLLLYQRRQAAVRNPLAGAVFALRRAAGSLTRLATPALQPCYVRPARAHLLDHGAEGGR
jgi:hypothetical protein